MRYSAGVTTNSKDQQERVILIWKVLLYFVFG